ncbi:YheU family protein [Ferrimonas lipolytica]|uniref:YheU family protein n=1 Tax=Ferrimonas lipolytica TaxID=2724191 RepID=A0A6H1UJ65_9GAMM|nr:YheU family protein [Ferrimonas lipolytica]QIZ77842.1 YheU family protein [Ferrimonas lipolytica]
MLIDYATLVSAIDADTIDNLLREFLLTQVSDEGFEQTDAEGLSRAITAARSALARAELVVEFSEEDESITVRRAEDIAR